MPAIPSIIAEPASGRPPLKSGPFSAKSDDECIREWPEGDPGDEKSILKQCRRFRTCVWVRQFGVCSLNREKVRAKASDFFCLLILALLDRGDNFVTFSSACQQSELRMRKQPLAILPNTELRSRRFRPTKLPRFHCKEAIGGETRTYTIQVFFATAPRNSRCPHRCSR